ncbi:MAG: holin [Dehalococcoidia bacterium]|nr:holin [Dehalococcoidia bacterium]
MDWSDVMRRAGWTFAQAVLGPLIAFLGTTSSGVVDVEAGTQAAIIGIGAGLAAVLSLIKSVAAQQLEARNAGGI